MFLLPSLLLLSNRHGKISSTAQLHNHVCAQRSLRVPSMAPRTESIRASKSVDSGVANGLIAWYETEPSKRSLRVAADMLTSSAMSNTLVRSGLHLPVDSTRGCPVSESFARPASVRPLKDRCLRHPKQVLQGYCSSNGVRPLVA